MKSRLLAIMFAITMFASLDVSATQGQGSQTIAADIPFEFTANNKTLPAGRYRIQPANDSRLVWRISNARARPTAFLLASGLAGNPPTELRVTFHRYEDKYFLVGFNTPSYEISLPGSRREKALRMAQGPAAPAEVISINTVAGGPR